MQDTLRLEKQVCFAIYSASNAVVRLYRPVLDQVGLTYPQYLVMMALWQQDGVPLRQLSEQTLLDAGTITPIVKRLEAKQLLKRRPDPDDERAKQVVLTQQGRALEADMAQRVQALYQSVDVDREELAQIKALCESLRKQISKRD